MNIPLPTKENKKFEDIEEGNPHLSQISQSSEEPTSPIELIEGTFWELYKSLATLGKGSCAIVKKVQCRETKMKYAAKIMRTSEPEQIGRSIEEFSRIFQLDHPNIVAMHKMYIDESLGYIYILMELCKGSSITDSNNPNQGSEPINEMKCKFIFSQIVAGVRLLHSRGIIHRDITPLNIIVSEEGDVKVIDFNVSKFLSLDTIMNSPRKQHKFKYGMMTQTGHPNYRAPEVILGTIYR